MNNLSRKSDLLARVYRSYVEPRSITLGLTMSPSCSNILELTRRLRDTWMRVQREGRNPLLRQLPPRSPRVNSSKNSRLTGRFFTDSRRLHLSASWFCPWLFSWSKSSHRTTSWWHFSGFWMGQTSKTRHLILYPHFSGTYTKLSWNLYSSCLPCGLHKSLILRNPRRDCWKRTGRKKLSTST